MAPSLRWDIFCRVVDNFGDAGVSWRLARQLAHEHGLAVTLWIDDIPSLARIAPALEVHRDDQAAVVLGRRRRLAFAARQRRQHAGRAGRACAYRKPVPGSGVARWHVSCDRVRRIVVEGAPIIATRHRTPRNRRPARFRRYNARLALVQPINGGSPRIAAS